MPSAPSKSGSDLLERRLFAPILSSLQSSRSESVPAIEQSFSLTRKAPPTQLSSSMQESPQPLLSSPARLPAAFGPLSTPSPLMWSRPLTRTPNNSPAIRHAPSNPAHLAVQSDTSNMYAPPRSASRWDAFVQSTSPNRSDPEALPAVDSTLSFAACTNPIPRPNTLVREIQRSQSTTKAPLQSVPRTSDTPRSGQASTMVNQNSTIDRYQPKTSVISASVPGTESTAPWLNRNAGICVVTAVCIVSVPQPAT